MFIGVGLNILSIIRRTGGAAISLVIRDRNNEVLTDRNGAAITARDENA